jgi:hypothetical protein
LGERRRRQMDAAKTWDVAAEEAKQDTDTDIT